MTTSAENRKHLHDMNHDDKASFIAAQQAIALHRIGDAMARIATSMETAPEAMAMETGIQIVDKVKDMLPESSDNAVKKGKQMVGKMKDMLG